MDNLKRRVTALGLHHKLPRRRRSSVDIDEVELQTIREEKSGDVGDAHRRMDEITESPHRRSVSEEVPKHRNSLSMEEVKLLNHRTGLVDEEKKLDKHKNGLPDDLDNRRVSSPSIERPVELRGEHRISSSDDSGAYTVCGLRHMDSGSSTQRSFDY
ncbi:hypothetical protein ANCDUO_21771, partial [Ancylostoma duodenale]